MNNLRSISKGIAVFLLLIVLFATPIIISLQAIANSPEAVKASLDKNNVYSVSVKSNLVAENSRLSSDVLSDNGIASALHSAVTPSYVKTSSDKLIDNIYAYIHGSMPSVELSVSISEVQTKFADNVASYIKQKFDTLPRCTQLTPPPASIESLLQSTCVPIGVSSQQASEYARSEIMNLALFANDRIEVADLVGMRESSLNSYLADARSAYPYFISLVYILPIIGIILAVGILLLSDTKRRGIKIIANTLLSAGLVNMLAAFVAVGLLGLILGGNMPNGSDAVDNFEGVILNLLGSLRLWWFGCAGLFIALSIVIYIILGITGRSRANSRIS